MLLPSPTAVTPLCVLFRKQGQVVLCGLTTVSTFVSLDVNVLGSSWCCWARPESSGRSYKVCPGEENVWKAASRGNLLFSLSVYVCVCSWVKAHFCTFMWRSDLGCLLLLGFLFCFNNNFSLSWGSSVRLGQLKRSACLCLSDARIPGRHLCTQLFSWVLGI